MEIEKPSAKDRIHTNEKMKKKKSIGLVEGFIAILIGAQIERRLKINKEIKGMKYNEKIDYLLKLGRWEAYIDILMLMNCNKRKYPANNQIKKHILYQLK